MVVTILKTPMGQKRPRLEEKLVKGEICPGCPTRFEFRPEVFTQSSNMFIPSLFRFVLSFCHTVLQA